MRKTKRLLYCKNGIYEPVPLTHIHCTLTVAYSLVVRPWTDIALFRISLAPNVVMTKITSDIEKINKSIWMNKNNQNIFPLSCMLKNKRLFAWLVYFAFIFLVCITRYKHAESWLADWLPVCDGTRFWSRVIFHFKTNYNWLATLYYCCPLIEILM